MGDQIEALKYLGVPAIIIAIALGLLFMLNIIGSILDFKGKVWPEIINFRGWRRRKKEEKAKQESLLEDVKTALDEMKVHYSPEKIAERDAWMCWVNSRAKVYDAALDELLLMQDRLKENNEITLNLYINTSRHRILDFARMVADDDALVSQEEFNRIYKVNEEYHKILNKYQQKNGEVDKAMKLIDEAYNYRLKHRSFIEDIRGL
jgi:hypothetical protein